MKFNNNSNNNARESVNVNTRGIQFMNSEGFSPSTLVYGYWNDMISIKIHPALEKSQQSDSKRFNYEEVVSTAITLEKAVTLLSKLESDIIPAYGSESKFRGVPVGGDSLIGIGTRMNDDGSYTSYLGIFKALDENTKKPDVAIFYEFKAGYTVDDYNPSTGEFNVTQNVPGELMLFASALRASVAALTNANAHSTRTVDKWFRDKLTNQLTEIGSKLGVAAPAKSWGGNSGGYKSRGGDIFSGNGGGNTEPAGGVDLDGGNASISKLSNIDDINQFM
jgi:hypothetical protein